MTYTIVDARYAKGKKVIRCESDGSGMKTRASRLAGGFGKWVHRSRGYTVSPRQAERFERLYADGWDRNTFTGVLIPPGPSDNR